jgi:hypothetical protein
LSNRRLYQSLYQLYYKGRVFIAFKTAYLQSITIQNTKAGFRRTGLVPFNPQTVISKLDIKLQTSIPTGPFSADIDLWISQILYNLTDTLLQTALVKNCIVYYQRSLPIPIFTTVAVLAKGTEILVYKVTFLTAENCILYKTNKVFSKYCRIKKTCICQEGIFTIKDIYNILVQKKAEEQIQYNKYSEKSNQNKEQSTVQYCSSCRKTSYNIQTFQKDIEKSNLSDSE